MSGQAFDKLLERADHLGVDRIAFPIDIFETATLLAEHAEAPSRAEELARRLNDPENYFTRHAALRALRLLGGPAASAQLDTARRLLRDDPHAPLRAEAVRYLAQHGGGSSSTEQALLAAQTDPQDYVREAASRALGAAGSDASA